jgi:hypothetical protein
MAKIKNGSRDLLKHELDNLSNQKNKTSDTFYKAKGEEGRPSYWKEPSKKKD